MCDVLRFWLRRGVDGFRVDVAHRVVKDAQLRDNPANPSFVEGMPEDRRVTERYSRNWHEVHDVHRLLRHTIEDFDDPPRLLAGEVNLDPPELVAYYGGDDQLHLSLNFHTIVDLPWRARELAGLVAEIERLAPPHAWPSWILSNHDKSRFPTRIGRPFARQANRLQHASSVTGPAGSSRSRRSLRWCFGWLSEVVLDGLRNGHSVSVAVSGGPCRRPAGAGSACPRSAARARRGPPRAGTP